MLSLRTLCENFPYVRYFELKKTFSLRYSFLPLNPNFNFDTYKYLIDPFSAKEAKKKVINFFRRFFNVVVRNTLENRYTYRYRGIEKSFFGDCGCITAAASCLSLCLLEEISRNNFLKIQTTFRLSPFWLSFLRGGVYFSRYFREVSFGFVLSSRSELPVEFDK